MVGKVLTLPQLEEGVFIGGWKSGRWRLPEKEFGDKFGGTGLWAGRSGGKSGGTGLPDGCPVTRRADSVTRQKSIQNSSSVAPPDWPGLPPDGPARGPARPNLDTSGRRFHHLYFCARKPLHL
jgi:hypothetical protein